MGDEYLFPYTDVRPVQDELLRLVAHCVAHKRHLVVHAPTGMGKTAATIAPALKHAIGSECCVVFVTPRHTQHIIALRTVKEIRQKYGADFMAMAIVGKRQMCAHENTAALRSDDFSTYCKAVREGGQCVQFINSRNGTQFSTLTRAAIGETMPLSPLSAEFFVTLGKEKTLCPYELALCSAERAKLIITDYSYLFMPAIRDKFLARINKKPEQLIVIVDEGHNLPARVRESLTHRMTSHMLRHAVNEAKDFALEGIRPVLLELEGALNRIGGALQAPDALVGHAVWNDVLKPFGGMQRCGELFNDAIEVVHSSNRKFSNIARVAKFMAAWEHGSGDDFARIVSRHEQGFLLTLRCLDPAMATREFIKSTHSTILMSGTLRPTAMFREQLGFPDDTIEKEFPSPFPVSNKLCIINPSVTTTYSKRDERQYAAIARECAAITNAIPGCSAVFFPSYAMLETVQPLLESSCTKTMFREAPGMTKDERARLLVKFSGYAAGGAVLLGVASGSFGEGIDMPGVLKGVVVVGVPLDHPTLETKQLINYYDKRYGKGWEYGYTLPALTRTLQNAGRCIRSETDRGVLAFLDYRYIQPSYKKCFPDDWEMKVTPRPGPLIEAFFSGKP